MKDIQLSFRQLRPTGGDETAPYEVILNRVCTLKELIEKIKSGTSHGDMWIYKDYGVYFIRNYEKNPMGLLPSGLFDANVKCVTAVGGWGRMDYKIYLV